MQDDQTPAGEASKALRLDQIEVAARPAEIEAFCRETGWSGSLPDGAVPHAFPICWLSAPSIRAALETKVRAFGGVAIHESQSFTYEAQLATGRAYVLSTEISEETNPQRVILRAAVCEPAQPPVLRMETILRIIPARMAS